MGCRAHPLNGSFYSLHIMVLTYLQHTNPTFASSRRNGPPPQEAATTTTYQPPHNCRNRAFALIFGCCGRSVATATITTSQPPSHKDEIERPYSFLAVLAFLWPLLLPWYHLSTPSPPQLPKSSTCARCGLSLVPSPSTTPHHRNRAFSAASLAASPTNHPHNKHEHWSSAVVRFLRPPPPP